MATPISANIASLQNWALQDFFIKKYLNEEINNINLGGTPV